MIIILLSGVVRCASLYRIRRKQRATSEEIKRRLLPYQKHPRNISNVPVVILHQSPINDGDNLYENQMSGYRRKSVEELQAEDVTYLVTNSWYYGPYLECDRERFSPVMKEKITEVRRFYSDVKNRGKEIIAFQPDFWTPGPIIKVYDISQN